MKKLFLVLTVLFLSFALFATDVKVGGVFNFINGTTSKSDNIEETKYKSNAAGFSVGGTYDISDEIAVWANFNMTFGFDAGIKEGEDDWIYINEMAEKFKKDYDATVNKSIMDFSVAAGAAYKIPMDFPVKVAAGAGIFFENSTIKLEMEGKSYGIAVKVSEKYKVANLGVSLYANAKYNFTDSIGVDLTLMPHFGIMNFTNFAELVKQADEETANSDDKANGIAFAFSMPIVLGVSYSF